MLIYRDLMVLFLLETWVTFKLYLVENRSVLAPWFSDQWINIRKFLTCYTKNYSIPIIGKNIPTIPLGEMANKRLRQLPFCTPSQEQLVVLELYRERSSNQSMTRCIHALSLHTLGFSYSTLTRPFCGLEKIGSNLRIRNQGVPRTIPFSRQFGRSSKQA